MTRERNSRGGEWWSRHSCLLRVRECGAFLPRRADSNGSEGQECPSLTIRSRQECPLHRLLKSIRHCEVLHSFPPIQGRYSAYRCRSCMIRSMRNDGRSPAQLRPIKITCGFTQTPAGSVLWEQG